MPGVLPGLDRLKGDGIHDFVIFHFHAVDGVELCDDHFLKGFDVDALEGQVGVVGKYLMDFGGNGALLGGEAHVARAHGKAVGFAFDGACHYVDVEAFESKVAAELGMPAELTFRYRSPYFKHIFGSDGYASGYYTYLWAEVLDTDGFELFKEKGIFDPETAKKFKENVLEKGGSVDPMELYVNFRGHEPTVDALLRNRGLIGNTVDLSSKSGK